MVEDWQSPLHPTASSFYSLAPAPGLYDIKALGQSRCSFLLSQCAGRANLWTNHLYSQYKYVLLCFCRLACVGEGNDFKSYGLTFLFNLIFISGEFTSVISLKIIKLGQSYPKESLTRLRVCQKHRELTE